MVSRICLCRSLAVVCFLVGAALLTAGLVVVLGVFPNIVHNQINDQKVLARNPDGTLNSFASNWVDNKYISTMQYWVFNYTNTIGIMNRAIFPDMIEKGPYAYDEIVTMDHLNFSENGEYMQFRQVQTFVFNPNKSCPDCDPYKDKILIPDIGFQLGIDQLDTTIEGILHSKTAVFLCQTIMKARNVPDPEEKCKDLGKLIEGEIGLLLSLFNVSPFAMVTVDQLLFSGYQTPFVEKFLDQAMKIFLFLFEKPYTPIASPPVALNQLNGTNPFLYTVLTGKTDPLKAGYITEFASLVNGTLGSTGDTLPPEWWPFAKKTYCDTGSSALKIKGTNADFFKNFVSRDEELPVYISDICRSAVLTYDRDVTVKGIKGYRFVLPRSQFDYTLPENCGYCIPLKYGAYEYPAESACLPSGLLDISQCSQGAPIIMSKPHFYQSDHIVEKFVPRFKSSYDTDETMIDIEPNTGTVLQANKRLQVNVLVNQYTHIKSLSVMRPGAYPLAWIDESFYMDKNTEDQLNSQLFDPISLVDTICWVAVGVGSGLIAVSIVMMIVSICCFGDDHKKTS